MIEELFGAGAEVELFDWLAAEFLRIRDRSGHLVPLQPNAVQKEYSRRRSKRNIVLKARQVGITTWIAARFFLKTILRPGTVTLQVAHTLESAQQIFLVVQRFLHHLPFPLLRAVTTSRANVRELAFAQIDSRYIVDTAGNPHAGRGITVHNLHASEVAMWPEPARETLAGLLAAVPPEGTVELESTPRGAGGCFYEEWMKSTLHCVSEPVAFTPHFFPWWLEPSYRRELLPGEEIASLNAEESDLVRQRGLSAEQIKYRRELRARYGSLAPQEFAEDAGSCFLVSGRPVFDVPTIDARLHELSTSLAELSSDSSESDMTWFEPEPDKSYVIGADVAEGSAGGDFSAACVVNLETGLQCAELLARWPVSRFAQELARLGRKYNSALLAVESNNQGLAVLLALEQQHVYPRLFKHPQANGEVKTGWFTNAQTKPQAIHALGRMLRDAPRSFRSRRLLEQCRAYSYRDDGSSGALPGAHDDLVMAAAIACAVRAQGGGVTLTSISLQGT